MVKLTMQISTNLARSSVSEPMLSRPAAGYQNKGNYRTALYLVEKRGLTGLYTGLYLHILRDTLATGVYFMTYESVKQAMTAYYRRPKPTDPWCVFIAGGLSGIACTVRASLPHSWNASNSSRVWCTPLIPLKLGISVTALEGPRESSRHCLASSTSISSRIVVWAWL